MVKYNCDKCGFLSTNKKDYTRHINTKKHKKNVITSTNESKMNPIRIQHESSTENSEESHSKRYECLYCNNSYSTQSNRSKHEKKCIKKLLFDKEIEELKKDNERIQKENERIQQEAKEKEKRSLQENKRIQKQLETYEKMLQSMTSPQTINYFNYIVQNFPNAPALEPQESYKQINDSKKMTLMDVVSMYHYDNKLVKFIGDYIVQVYKHEESDNQSIWSTDISRLTYIISESCNKDGTNWAYDKKGSKTKKTIIEPALQYIRSELLKFCQENGTNSKTHILKKMIAANATIQNIDNGELAEKINKYIAPEFSFKQNDKEKAMIKV